VVNITYDRILSAGVLVEFTKITIILSLTIARSHLSFAVLLKIAAIVLNLNETFLKLFQFKISSVHTQLHFFNPCGHRHFQHLTAFSLVYSLTVITKTPLLNVKLF